MGANITIPTPIGVPTTVAFHHGESRCAARLQRYSGNRTHVFILPHIDNEPHSYWLESSQVLSRMHSNLLTSKDHTSLLLARAVGKICEAQWESSTGPKWCVSRITHIGKMIELQCDEFAYELPVPLNSLELFPLGTHLSRNAPSPLARVTHRQKIARLENENKALTLQIELAKDEEAFLKHNLDLTKRLHSLKENHQQQREEIEQYRSLNQC